MANENGKDDGANRLVLAGAATRFQKGNPGGPGRPPKARATHLALAALADVGLDAARTLVKHMRDADPKVSGPAARYILTLLHKAGRLERELTESEERELDEATRSMSDAELAAKLAAYGQRESDARQPAAPQRDDDE